MKQKSNGQRTVQLRRAIGAGLIAFAGSASAAAPTTVGLVPAQQHDRGTAIAAVRRAITRDDPHADDPVFADPSRAVCLAWEVEHFNSVLS